MLELGERMSCGKRMGLVENTFFCNLLAKHVRRITKIRALNPVQTLSVRFVFVFFFFLLIKNPIQSRFKSAVSAFFSVCISLVEAIVTSHC